MARPKGSKNKSRLIIENVDEKIVAVEAEITELDAALKAKKAELKNLKKAKLQSEKAAAKAAAEKKAEEDKAKVLEAIAQSGKSVDEILDLLFYFCSKFTISNYINIALIKLSISSFLWAFCSIYFSYVISFNRK